jgi:replicative DNA helicase
MSNRETLEREAIGGLTYEGNFYTTDLDLDDFKLESHRQIFQVIQELAADGEPIDYLTIHKKSKFLGIKLDISEITKMHDEAGSSYSHGFHSKALKEYNALEALNELGKDIAKRSKTGDKSENIVESVEDCLQTLNNGPSRAQITKVNKVVNNVIEGIQEAYNAKNGMLGIETGLDHLDDITRGFRPGQLIFIGARPAEGKTTLTLQMAGAMARKGIPVGFFSMEMSEVELVEKLVVSESGLSGRAVKSGFLKNSDFTRLSGGAGVVHDYPFYIYDRSGCTMAEIRGRAKYMVRKHGVKAIFIDYIGLVSGGDGRQPRHEQIAQIARDMKVLARQLEVPVIVPAQVRREAEDKKEREYRQGCETWQSLLRLKSRPILSCLYTLLNIEKTDITGWGLRLI